jgi:tetratricopeptide (TPR) repeat protein
MKSEHRHELKTNELAEWLGNLPQWTKENLVTIVIVSVLIVGLAGFYIWRGYNRNVVQVRQRADFTRLLSQVSAAKMQIVQAQEQENVQDLSFRLLQAADPLGAFARTAKNDRMAALAFIEQAHAIRAELHYGTAEEDYFDQQIGKAADSYTNALDRSAGNTALAAAAEFGLGLCDEELGNFEQARLKYQQIVANADYKATVPVAQAERRLKIMGDYKEQIEFKPNPSPKPEATSQPSVDVRPSSPQMPENIIPPFDFRRPLDLSMFPEPNDAGAGRQ